MDLTGVWKLKDYYVCEENGTERHYNGAQRGTLHYTDDGKVSTYIQQCDDKPELSEEEWQNVPPFWYEGTYRIKPNNTVIHSVEKGSRDDMIGIDLVRHFKYKENDLIIEGFGAGSKKNVRLVWTCDFS